MGALKAQDRILCICIDEFHQGVLFLKVLLKYKFRLLQKYGISKGNTSPAFE